MPHLHLSLQAGDDLVLKRMKRRHGRADALAVTRRARDLRPEIAFGADLIAGFPTETEAMFENTLALIEEAGLAYLHVFPYSERPGTPAARMPAVPRLVRKARAQRLREAGGTALNRHLDRQRGRTVRAVIETELFARAEDFSPIAIQGGAPGTILPLQLVARQGDRLLGRPIS
jgi:threonylcarbamoyladenosine tRNA methylthiotransferase MtaB